MMDEQPASRAMQTGRPPAERRPPALSLASQHAASLDKGAAQPSRFPLEEDEDPDGGGAGDEPPARPVSPASTDEQPGFSAWEDDASLEREEEDVLADIPEMLSPAHQLQKDLLEAGALVPFCPCSVLCPQSLPLSRSPSRTLPPQKRASSGALGHW